MALITDSLVANWEASSFSSGTSWIDSISQKVLTLSSSPTKSDDGIEFTSSITFSSNSLASLSLSYPISFEWIGRIDTKSISNNSPGNLFCLSNNNGNWSGICCYSKSSSNGIQLDIGSSGTVVSGVYDSGIHHILVIINSSGVTTLYIDSATQKGSQSSSNTNSKVAKTYLYNTEGSNRFVGAISSMRIWNKELTSDEINAIFSAKTDGDVAISISTNYSTYQGTLDNIIDKSTSTYWWSGDAQSSGKYIDFYFSSPITFTGLTAQTLNNTSDCISNGNVLQVSTDRTSYITVGNFTGQTSCSFTELNQKNITNVKIYADTSSTKWLCVNEITLNYSIDNIKFFTKINNTWQNVSAVYRKENNIWIKLTDLSNVFSEATLYTKQT